MKFNYEVPLLSPTGVAVLLNNPRQAELRKYLEKEFPKFKFVGFGARPIGSDRTPIGFVKMKGEVWQEVGEGLIRPKVEQFVRRYIRASNQR